MLRRRRDDFRKPYPSLRYQHKSDVLWERYQQGIIDHNRYLELLEENKAEEIDSENKKLSFVGGIDAETKSRIERDIWEYENLMQEAREKEIQRKAEEKRKQALSPLEKYKEEVPETIARYRKYSKSNRRIANILQIIIIAGSVLATSATSALGFGLEAFKWIAPVISIVVAISAGFTSYFKFKERSFNLQQTADAIEQEYVAVELGIDNYRGRQPQEALEIFAEKVESLKDEQKKREQQLEQPPDTKHSQTLT